MYQRNVSGDLRPIRLGVIGGINMDIHLFGADGVIGDILVAEHYLAEAGGKGANQARAAARLGAEVVLVGAVGADEYGRDCVAAVAADEVDTTHVLTIPDERTGFVVIDLVEGHHVTRVFVPGANHRLEWSHVETALPALATCDILVVQAEIPSPVLDRLPAWSAGRGIPLFLDPTPPEAVSVDALAAAEVLTPNLIETGGLTGRAIEGEAGIRLAAGDLLALGAQRACIKLGAGGTMICEPDGFTVVPTVEVQVIDETGGGDVYMAALAVSRVAGADWPQAVAFANAAAALSVSREGLYLPTRSEVGEVRARIPV